MTTAVAAPPARVTYPYDRIFYSGLAIAMALTVVAGFGPTYYFRSYTGTPTFSGLTTIPPLVHLHGLVFSAWVVLFITQTQLVARRNVALHRRLGMASIGLALAMILVGWNTAIEAGRRGAAPEGTDPVAFLVVPIFDIVLFAVFVTAAIVMRRNRDAHKRLMILAYASIMTAAVARLPGVLPLGPFGFFGLAFVFVLLGVAYDIYSRRRVHPVYIWGGLLFVVSVPGRLLLSSTPVWRAFADAVLK